MDAASLTARVTGLISQNPGSRTFSFVEGGEKYWVKRPEEGEANGWHQVMYILSRVLNNNFFRPTVVTDPTASLAYEAGRLRQLREGGIRVPAIVLQTPNYLVLEDAGTPLSVLLGSSAMKPEEKKLLVSQLSNALAQLHNRGFFHSRPALRDIAYKEGEIYFMDFEENLEKALSTEEAIVRDGFLYAHTLYRKLRSPELAETGLDAYHRALRADLWDNLTEEARRYRMTYHLLRPLYRFLGKDGKAICDTLAYFRRF